MKNTILWKTAAKLVSYNTVSNLSTLACSEYVANCLDRKKFKTKIITHQIDGVKKSQVVAWIGPKVKGGLILSGHMDIVPFANQPGWTGDALKLRAVGNKIIGRGTSDMKIFIAHCLDAFGNLPLARLKRPIVCVFTCDEETCCMGSHRLIPDLLALKLVVNLRLFN